MSVSTGGSSVVVGAVPTSEALLLCDETRSLDLLRRIHLSALPTETKNHLRDILFTARSEQRSVLTEAEWSEFVAAGVVTAAPTTTPTTSGNDATAVSTSEVPASASTAAPTWSSRMQPTFGVQSPTVQTPVAPVPMPADPVVAAAPVPEAEPVRATAPVNPELASEPEAVATVVADTAPVPEALVEETVSATEAPAPAIDSVLPASVSTPTSTSAGDRINAIKREVNTLVGNPVNLIDVNNDVGREYMNALLDAMKKSGGTATEQEVARAMSRLEAAFVAVKTAVTKGATVEPIEPITQSVPESTTEEPTPESDPEIELTAAAEPEPPVDESPVATLKVTSVVDAAPESEALEVPVAAAAELPPEPEASTAPVIPTIASLAGTDVVPPAQASPVSAAPVLETQTSLTGITSVAKDKQIDALMAAQKVAQQAAQHERAAADAANPFMSEDVTQGLRQLLSEWKLFKSSGIFGTGPSGDEHPLYKQLAPLTMAAVLAGRFEGATPEIKQNIAEYMNGWRYEEGITHELGETFEQYLRRVIRHILDKKKPKVDAG